MRVTIGREGNHFINIKGLGEMTIDEINSAIGHGARFVVFRSCVSLLVVTFQTFSSVCFIRPGESAIGRGLPYTLTALLLGWWGLPWGPVRTVGAVATNFSGGKDVTDQVMRFLNRSDPGAAQHSSADIYY